MALETLLSGATRLEYRERVADSLACVPEKVREDAIEYTQDLLDRGNPVLFDAAHLAFVSGVDPRVLAQIRRQPPLFYKKFVIRKRSGGSRQISAPTPSLRAVQDWVHLNLTPKLRIHDAAQGFVEGRSIVSNARPHAGQPLILKLDIKDFFGSVRRPAVYRAFRRLGYRRELSDLLTTLVTLNGSLPQGAPTSPALANHAAYGLDVRIRAYTEMRGISYTRYADDLTLSGGMVGDRRVRRTVERIMRDEGFHPNEAKRRFVHSHEQQRVTGIVVNDRVNWPRSLRRWLRQEIHYLDRFGVESHLDARGVTRANYRSFIYGHVYALHMVRPREAIGYLTVLDGLDWNY